MNQSCILTGDEAQQAEGWLALAAEAARQSVCCRRLCGSVLIAADGSVLASGCNGLPGATGQSKIHCDPYALPPGFKSDKTCCIHAEQRVILRALQDGKNVRGSTMVFASVDPETKTEVVSGHPCCTICSKMALESGVVAWILRHESGITKYDAAFYNQISFA